MTAPKPKLIVFDLDYTLWPFWVCTHVQPPFSKNKSGQVVDSRGRKINCYPEVLGVLNNLKEKGFTMGVASRTESPNAAKELMNTLDIDKYFNFKEIYPGCKVTHFKKLQQDSGLDYKQMLFFDDEPRNIKDITKLGVTCNLVTDGFNKKSLDTAMDDFARSNL